MFKLTDTQRNIVLGVMTVVILGVINTQIVGKERILADGNVVLLELAPRDPRSLLQGDYMALRYAMTERVATAAGNAEVTDGNAVIMLDDRQVASFQRLHDGSSLNPGESLLRFRMRGDTVRLASDAYFFEEGQWKTFESARYGELRVDDDGNAVLTGLRDENFQPLGPAT